MKTAAFSEPPSSVDNWTHNDNCKHICDLPHPDSPDISVIPRIGKPRRVILSSDVQPNVICFQLGAKIDAHSKALL